MLLLLTERDLSFLRVKCSFLTKKKSASICQAHDLKKPDRKVAMICDCFWTDDALDEHASLMEVGIQREG